MYICFIVLKKGYSSLKTQSGKQFLSVTFYKEKIQQFTHKAKCKNSFLKLVFNVV